VQQWIGRYLQRTWLRQLDAQVGRDKEDALLRLIDKTDGTPSPGATTLAGRWVRDRLRRAAAEEATYCAEVVAAAYLGMALLRIDRRRVNA